MLPNLHVWVLPLLQLLGQKVQHVWRRGCTSIANFVLYFSFLILYHILLHNFPAPGLANVVPLGQIKKKKTLYPIFILSVSQLSYKSHWWLCGLKCLSHWYKMLCHEMFCQKSWVQAPVELKLEVCSALDNRRAHAYSPQTSRICGTSFIFSNGWLVVSSISGAWNVLS